MSGVKENWAQVKADAAKWAIRAETSLSADERAAFEAWRAADPRRDVAYKAAAAAWRNLSAMAEDEEMRIRFAAPSWRERTMETLRGIPPLHWLGLSPGRWAASAAAVAAVVLLALNLALEPPVYETRAAQSRAVTLADGSFIALSGNSRLETSFTKTERRVALTRGDAFFTVTKDPARPFVVVAGDTLIRVVGTKFNIHRDSQEVRVAVVEGVVQVALPQEASPTAAFPQDSQTLVAGQQMRTVRKGAQKEMRITKLDEPTRIQPTRLDYRGAKLRDVIAESNRYYAPGIVLESDDLGDLEVTMAFQSTDIERTVEGLKDILPLDVQRNSDGRILIRRRD